jgi:hypothetical protein
MTRLTLRLSEEAQSTVDATQDSSVRQIRPQLYEFEATRVQQVGKSLLVITPSAHIYDFADGQWFASVQPIKEGALSGSVAR